MPAIILVHEAIQNTLSSVMFSELFTPRLPELCANSSLPSLPTTTTLAPGMSDFGSAQAFPTDAFKFRITLSGRGDMLDVFR